jgi:hypothetical protein
MNLSQDPEILYVATSSEKNKKLVMKVNGLFWMLKHEYSELTTPRRHSLTL